MFHIKIRSSNDKTGVMPVSSSPKSTCPDNCPLKDKNGCYGDNFPMALHWNKVSTDQRGGSFTDLCDTVKTIPDNTLWRHNQVGDLPGSNNRINVRQLAQLVAANAGKKGYTYTHKPMTPHNLKAVQLANDKGFTINLSANNIKHADELMELGLPVATMLPIDSPKKQLSPNGHRLVTCPATYQDKTKCTDCGLCQVADRDFIIGFPVHGASKAKANLIAKG